MKIMGTGEIIADTTLQEEMVLCRYLDLPKYIDLLRTSELYLANATEFEDSLEGTLPELFRSSPRALGERTIEEIQQAEFKLKLGTNISCWSFGPNDNMALWKLYGRSNQSVCIVTTFHNLLYSAPHWVEFGQINFKEVKYIDHAGNIPDGIYTLDEKIFGYKHLAYKFEEEFRIVVTRNKKHFSNQLRLPIVLNDLIKKVTVAPNSGKWFFELVKDITKKYKVSSPVEMSGLASLIERVKR